MIIIKKATLSELVCDDYRLASVFKNYGIDYYCRGERTVEEVCVSKNIKRKVLVCDLQNAVIATQKDHLDFHLWTMNQLTSYIEKRHHSYVEIMAPVILDYLYILCREYGDLRPDILCIMELFTTVIKKIENHNNKERLILFPYIRKIESLELEGEIMDNNCLGIMQIQMQTIIQENNFEGQHFLEIRELCNNYIPQQQISRTYTIVLELLNDFESKLELQLHLENNLLFPKSLEAETNLLKTQSN